MIGKSYIINLDTRPDRLQTANAELSRLGIKAERFAAHTGETPFLAFNSSQYHCLKNAIDSGHAYFTIYEDDVKFSAYGHAINAIDQLPMDFDILQLGCNLLGSDMVTFDDEPGDPRGIRFKRPKRYSENLFRLYDAWQTHSVVYSRKCAEWIVNHWDYMEAPTYDEWLRVNVYPYFNCFVMAPQITFQAPGFSDIWNVQSDYTSCFERGNKILV